MKEKIIAGENVNTYAPVDRFKCRIENIEKLLISNFFLLE